MTLPLYGAVGDLFNRLGKLGLLVSNVGSFQSTLLTSMTNTSTGVVAQYNAESDLQAIMGGAYQGLLSSLESPSQLSQQLATLTLNRMVFRDQPQANQTLTQIDLTSSLLYLIQQMKSQGATVLAMTITTTPVAFVGTGNGVIVMSNKRAIDGLVCENSFSETLTVLCTQDSYIGGATAGNEGFTITGEGQQEDVFAFDWPLGSNCSTGCNAIDSNSDATAGNILTNSGFDAWTSNLPDNWTALTGTTPGTNLFEESSIVYDPTSGGKALRFLGDGATNLGIAQIFNSTTGTTGTLSALTQVGFNIFMRRDGVAPAAGVLQVELVNGSGTIIKDANNANNSFTIDLTALTTVYTSYTGTFRLPHVLPSSMYIRYRMTTPLTNNRSVYLDASALGLMTQLYTSGPSLAVFSGSVPFVQGDYSYSTVTNSYGSGGTLTTWQVLFNRLFSMQQLDLLLPSSATPSIPDSAIS